MCVSSVAKCMEHSIRVGRGSARKGGVWFAELVASSEVVT